MKAISSVFALALACSMIATAAPVGICLYAYSPEAPAEKIECFEFERVENVQSGKRFFLPDGKTTIVTNYRNRGIVLYPGLSGQSAQAMEALLASYEAHALRSPSSRKFLNPWIIKLRNTKKEAEKQEMERDLLPSVLLPDGTTLKHCRAIKRDDTAVSVMHDGGIAKIAISDLSESAKNALHWEKAPKINKELSQQSGDLTPESELPKNDSNSMPGDSAELSPAQKWLREDCTGQSVDYREFAFGISQMEIERRFMDATGSRLSIRKNMSPEKVPEGMTVLEAEGRVIVLLNDRVIAYERTFDCGKSGPYGNGNYEELKALQQRDLDQGLAKAMEKMQETINALKPASHGPIIEGGTDGGSRWRYCEISASNFLGHVCASSAGGMRFTGSFRVKVYLVSRSYIASVMAPSLDLYTDSLHRFIKEGKKDPLVKVEGGTIEVPQTLSAHLEWKSYEHGPFETRALIGCLSNRFRPKDGTTSVIAEFGGFGAKWVDTDGFKIEIKPYLSGVKFEKPVKF